MELVVTVVRDLELVAAVAEDLLADFLKVEMVELS